MRGRAYPPDARGRFLKDATTAVVHHCGMEPTINFITLGVPDLEAARRFYVDGLGWEPTLEVEGEVVFIQVSRGQLLGLWWADKLEADAGAAGGAPPAEYRGAGMVLSHNVGSEEDVVRVLEEAAAAGGTILRAGGAQPRLRRPARPLRRPGGLPLGGGAQPGLEGRRGRPRALGPGAMIPACTRWCSSSPGVRWRRAS